MRLLRLLLVTACTAVAAGALNVGVAAGQDLPDLERGDTGSGVELWQDQLGDWLAYARPAMRITDDAGTFGASTEEATRELQRFVGLEPTGEVDERTWVNLYDRKAARASLLLRRSDAVVPAWPIPLPQWYWEWARWTLGHGEFRNRQRDPAVRPAAAPARIPAWAWRRAEAGAGQDLQAQAVRLVQDRVRAIFGETLRMPPQVAGSDVVGGWIFVGSSLVGHDQGTVAAWLRLVQGRWVPWNLGRSFPEEPDRPQVNPDPRFVPCDLRQESPGVPLC
jgi:hypothetical protein